MTLRSSRRWSGRTRPTASLRRGTAAAISAVLVASGLAMAGAAGPAAADTAPPPIPGGSGTLPATVSADALPTVQINGIVWSQVTVGNTVYATGSFTSARPAGAPAGTNETPRGNLIAYDIRTGAMLPFDHKLNAQGLVVAASPDGSRVYVGGEFTTVDGLTRNRIAAFDTATGALTSFAPSMDAKVKAIGVTPGAVYLGGVFTKASGNVRKGLAAFSPTNGALLSWAPSVDNGTPNAMVVTPDGSRVIVGGSFTTIGGAAAYGLAAINATTGALLPWAAAAKVRNAGSASSLTSLRTDGKLVYGTGYVYGAGGNLEGMFAADPDSGDIRFLEDCHGDSYDSVALGDVVYVVSHSHHCGNIGAFPEKTPRTFQRTTAYTNYATSTVGHNSTGNYYDWFGLPAPTQLTWYPDLDVGTYSGQSQAAWAVTGNSDYVALGGEFPKVNNTGQQGLVRFAVRAIAPNQQGPRYNAAALTPTVFSQAPTTARVSWNSDSDPDNVSLTYTVVRDGQKTTPVTTVGDDTPFWKSRRFSFTDTGLAPGSTHTYRVYATDPLGNQTFGNLVTVQTAASADTGYAKAVLDDSPSAYWRLGESTGTTSFDRAGYDDLTLAAGATRNVAGSLGSADGDAATRFSGTATGTSSSSVQAMATTELTSEAWFRTTSTAGGAVVAFGSSTTGASGNHDRSVYLDNAGHVLFGVYDGAVRSLASPNTYNDGQWHHVAATLSSAGTALYVDGARVGRDSTATRGNPFLGYWRIGGDNLANWPSKPTSSNLAGDIDEVAVYTRPLSAARIAAHVSAAGRVPAAGPSAPDAYGRSVLADDPESFWRLDEATGVTAAVDSSGSGAPGTYSGGTTRRVASPVTGSAGTGARFNGTDGIVTAQRKSVAPTTYSLEAWFSTTSTTGGKLIGLGDKTTGLSTNYDRHVFLTTTGQIVYGIYSGTSKTVTSPGRYNDGRWHQVVATQGSSGMALYVDGALVGTNSATGPQAYTGYWRIGGDRTWAGATTNYLSAAIDEVAIYPSTLSAPRVAAHYKASPVSVTQPRANRAPTASVAVSGGELTASFDGSGSVDPDGEVTRWAWTFGDGDTGSGATTTHTYAAAGTYPVTLTVTDDSGATASASGQVTVTAPVPNDAPAAAFTATATDLAVALDGTGSSDPDGSLAGFAWDFGDGSTGTGSTPSHTYPAGGTYTVSLTVTDDRGATGTTTHEVTVVDPTAGFSARDRFGRTTTNGLGTADKGGSWVLSYGSASSLSVDAGVASLLTTAGGNTGAYLSGLSTDDADVRVALSVDKLADQSLFTSVVGRRVAKNTEYRGQLKVLPTGAVVVGLGKLAGSTAEVAFGPSVTVPGLTYTPGARLAVRLQVTGTNPTTVRMKVWRAEDAEPAEWTVSATDSDAVLQAPGSVGLRSYLSGLATTGPVTLSVSDLQVRPTA